VRNSSGVNGMTGAGQGSIGCSQCGASASHFLFRKFDYDLVQCAGCDLVFVGNPPDFSELEDMYSPDVGYHDDILTPKSAEYKRMDDIAQRHMAIVTRYAKSGKLLDVGCSTGLFLHRAKQAGFDCGGVEFSRQSAEFARRQFGIDVLHGDISTAADRAGSYDMVTMFDVIEHVPDPSKDIRAIHDLLKPGGLFILSTPNIDGLFPRLSYPFAKILDYWPHPEPPHHLYQFSVGTMAALLERNGFETVKTHHTNIDLAYSFGTPKAWRVSPKMLAYALAFAPSALIGPLIRSGDWFYMVGRKVG
jgi:2-polyprenyl-3-methyl-5-hydroxy-6-metoxy-1,4-benzoquinol methylase